MLKNTVDRWRTSPDEELPRGLCREEWTALAGLYERGGPNARAARGDPCAYPADILRNRTIVRLSGIESLGPEFDLRPGLRKLRVPALVVEGQESNVPLEATREWARALTQFFRGHWPPEAIPNP